MSTTGAPAVRAHDVRQALRAGAEIGLLDVRPEARFAQGHPLFAACLDADRLELEAVRRLPRADAPLVVYGEDESDSARAAERLGELGYRDVRVLAGGVEGWLADGGELFADVNSPSKAFGELVAERLQTPAIEAAALGRLLDAGAAVTVLDARRPDEYRTMSIPTAASAPGATLVRAVAGRDERSDELVVVNCAGRTRSIIGAQSLINAGVAARVAALRNGTIGWMLAARELEHGQRRRLDGPVSERACAAARRLADRAGVRRLRASALAALVREGERTLYLLDVRSTESFEAGHPAGFRSAPGGQLVQETDHHAPIRGALLVLADDGGSEADMTASWLAQMGWDVAVLDGVRAAAGGERGPAAGPTPPMPEIEWWSAGELAASVGDPALTVLDLGRYHDYLAGHVPTARWASRAALLRGDCALPDAGTVVVTADDPALIAFGVADLRAAFGARSVGLEGGTPGWAAGGRALEHGEVSALSAPLDRYRRPYEGTDVSPEAMRAYLEWEYGLVAQLERDRTHRFTVLGAEHPQP
jgi:rhodanese-related sulfurtransferase